MLKPFFLIGATITAFAFIGTVCSVHFARYGEVFIHAHSRWLHSARLETPLNGAATLLPKYSAG